ncbi:MAG: hypothetical protein AAGC95_18570 [Pseudomonadota bacterium]
MDDDISDADLEALELELPSLMTLKRFAEGLHRPNWFSRVGEAASNDDRVRAGAYLDRLGFPDADIAILVDWEDAAGAAESADWHSPAWEAEELARADLTERALGAVSEEALNIGLALVAEKAAEAVRAGAEESAALWDAADEAAQRAGVGAAVQACHNAALAIIATGADPDFDPGDHPFAYKYALFEAGRWPVGVIGASFNMF